jgi:hypothetical protein
MTSGLVGDPVLENIHLTTVTKETVAILYERDRSATKSKVARDYLAFEGK